MPQGPQDSFDGSLKITYVTFQAPAEWRLKQKTAKEREKPLSVAECRMSAGRDLIDILRIKTVPGSTSPWRKPNGITKADREARKSDDLLKKDFKASERLTKCVTDTTEIKAGDGKLYVSAVFDCFGSGVIGLAMDTSMKASLCVQTLENVLCDAQEDVKAVYDSNGSLAVWYEHDAWGNLISMTDGDGVLLCIQPLL